jgi:hypothetical protein
LFNGDFMNKLQRLRKITRRKNMEESAIKKIFVETTSSAAGAGMGVGAVAASGSVVGLSGSGIMSGLAALGCGLGAATGVGVVVVIGGVTAYGTKKLLNHWLD